MGEWIEIANLSATSSFDLSHPSWVSGLKLLITALQVGHGQVSPFMGEWIEI